MPRKRIIDPEFWADEEIGRWPFEARLFYIGLWNFADDAGRLKAHPNLLKAQIFPYDQKIDIEKIKNIVSGKVAWYSVEGSQYGEILNFLKYQRIDRPTPSKIPNRYIDSNEPKKAPKTTEIKSENIAIQEPHTLQFDFESIWLKYPKRDGKKDAMRHFKASVKTEQDWNDINKALQNYIKSEPVQKGFIKNGSTWFNNWRDWVISPITKPTESHHTKQQIQLIPEWKTPEWMKRDK